MSYPPLIDLRIGFWPVVHFIRPCWLFPIDNLSIYAQNFFKFCIHIVIGDEWYWIVNGQNATIFDGVTALSPFKKWFLACYSFTVYDIWMKLHRYVEQQRLHITTKDSHSYLSSSWVIRPWLIWKMFLTCSSFTIWNIWMELHRYVDHQKLHIVTKDIISLSISVLLLFRHYISHKITFCAPSSGGVLCSACGAFIDLFSVYLKTIDHLSLKLLIFVGILQVLRFDLKKFRILEILNFHPCKGLTGFMYWSYLWFQNL